MRRLPFDDRRSRRLQLELEEQAQLAAEAERTRMARELHDLVAHSLSLMTVQAGGVRRLLREDQVREREALEAIEATGRQALTEMRRMLGMLGKAPPVGGAPLEPQPGMASLAALIGRVRDAGLPVDYRVKGEPVALAPGVDVSAYRIVQDALEKALDGSGASGAKVEVRWGSGSVELEVSHDGEVDGPGDELAGSRERVALLGGRLESGIRIGGGHSVRARLPIREDGRA